MFSHNNYKQPQPSITCIKIQFTRIHAQSYQFIILWVHPSTYIKMYHTVGTTNNINSNTLYCGLNQHYLWTQPYAFLWAQPTCITCGHDHMHFCGHNQHAYNQSNIMTYLNFYQSCIANQFRQCIHHNSITIHNNHKFP